MYPEGVFTGEYFVTKEENRYEIQASRSESMTLVLRVRTCISMDARVNVNEVSTNQREFSG